MAHALPTIAFQSPKADTWTLQLDFSLAVPDWCTVHVPKGYTGFNGASIPRIAWTAIGRNLSPGFVRASLVHDYLYDTPEARGEAHWKGLVSDRKGVDDLFLAMLRHDGVGAMRSRIMHFAVRTAGGGYFTEKAGEEPRRRRTPPDEVQVGRRIAAAARRSTDAWYVERTVRKGIQDRDAVDPDALRTLNIAALPESNDVVLFEAGLTWQDVDERLTQVGDVDWDAALKVLEAAGD